MNIYKKAVNHYGKEAQLLKAIEEFAELAVELAKHLQGENNADNVEEEIADAEIMLKQLEVIYDIKGIEIESSVKAGDIPLIESLESFIQLNSIIIAKMRNEFTSIGYFYQKALNSIHYLRIVFSSSNIDNQIAFKLDRLNKRMEGEI